MKKQLFIDTTNKYCYIGLAQSKKKIDEIKILVNKNVTDIIVNTIFSLLEKNNVVKNDIDKIYLNLGPGSFTGVRVGVIIAKVWKLVIPSTKIYGINSLLLQIPKKNAISVIDAKSNKVYVSVYKNNECIIKAKIITNNELDDLIKKYDLKVYKNIEYNFFDHFVTHVSDFKEIFDLTKIQPLYLKGAL